MKLLAFGALALTALAGTSAAAQDQAFGPALPGVCVYNHDRLLAQSTAGQAVQAGMQRLGQEVEAELLPYQQFVVTEREALRQGRTTIPQADFERRAQELEARFQEGQQRGQVLQNELRYTQGMQLQAITQAADPVVLALYAERGCGILISRESVLRVNPTMELTDAAIQRVNAALPTLSFNRMSVPANAQAQ